jgi:hypothetical protein
MQADRSCLSHWQQDDIPLFYWHEQELLEYHDSPKWVTPSRFNVHFRISCAVMRHCADSTVRFYCSFEVVIPFIANALAESFPFCSLKVVSLLYCFMVAFLMHCSDSCPNGFFQWGKHPCRVFTVLYLLVNSSVTCHTRFSLTCQ